jgi:hypothetical protein
MSNNISFFNKLRRCFVVKIFTLIGNFLMSFTELGYGFSAVVATFLFTRNLLLFDS